MIQGHTLAPQERVGFIYHVAVAAQVAQAGGVNGILPKVAGDPAVKVAAA